MVAKIVTGVSLSLTMAMLLTGCGGSDNNNVVGTFSSNSPSTMDSYEGSSGDDNLSAASSIETGAALQARSIYPQGDEDWVAVTLNSGTEYELFTTNLNETGDTYLYLHDENGTQVSSDDDYIDYDSHIVYTAPYTGTYYLMVRSYSTDEQTSYQLGVRVNDDSDGDGYSTFYDCDDTNASIYPFVTEIPGDGIDQDCSGVDAPVVTVADSYEDDDDIASAKTLYETESSVEEIIHRTALYNTARTIDAALEQDFYKFTVPAESAVYVIDYTTYSSSETQLQATVLDENGTEIDTDTRYIYLTVENPSSSSRDFYVRFEAADGLSQMWYAPAVVPIGTDRDGDGYYTKDWSIDCNDNDALIYPGATELIGDGIDNDCDGLAE